MTDLAAAHQFVGRRRRGAPALVEATRQAAMLDKNNENYANIEQITEEVRNARRLFATNGWPVIDVTNRSVEETAAAILQYYNRWCEKR